MGEESSVFSQQWSVKGYQISVIREQEARVASSHRRFCSSRLKKKQIPRFARDDMEDVGMKRDEKDNAER
jgi:hypothetical protein